MLLGYFVHLGVAPSGHSQNLTSVPEVSSGASEVKNVSQRHLGVTCFSTLTHTPLWVGFSEVCPGVPPCTDAQTRGCEASQAPNA